MQIHGYDFWLWWQVFNSITFTPLSDHADTTWIVFLACVYLCLPFIYVAPCYSENLYSLCTMGIIPDIVKLIHENIYGH